MRGDVARLIDALEDLLDQERDLLLDGRLDGLRRIADLKAGLVGDLANAPAAPEWDRVAAKAARNARLLEVAGQGLRSALERISAIRNGPAPLATYSRQGVKRDLDRPAPGGLERRA